MNMRLRRWLATGVAGAIFTVLLLAGALPVAAVGNNGPLVVPVPGSDPSSNVQTVASPGFIDTGAASAPVTTGSGVNQTVVVNGQYYYVDANGQYIPYYGGVPSGYFFFNGNYGQYVLVNGVPYFVTIGGQYVPVSGAAFTQSGPIIAINPNGVIVVQTFRDPSDISYYVIDPTTGRYVETDVNGKPLNTAP